MRIDPKNVTNQVPARQLNKSQKKPAKTESGIKDSVSISDGKNPRAGKQRITIVHTNDMHGQAQVKPGGETGRWDSGLPLVGAAVKREKERNENVILLDAGDISSGTVVSDYYKAIPMMDGLNHLGYDAMTLGNHEFDGGREALKELVAHAKFPVISANVKDKSHDPINIKPYIMKQVGDVKVGIMGLTTLEVATMISNPEDKKALEFLSVEDTAKKTVPRMREEGADVVVVLSHLGYEEDKKLAKSVKGIDFIIGGHSHTKATGPEDKKPGKFFKFEDTVIVSTGAFGEKVGKLDIDVKFDKKGKADIDKVRSKLMTVGTKSLEPDPAIKRIINKYARKLNKIMGKKIGETKVDLTQRDYHTFKEESTLGNYVTDAVRRMTNTDVCLLNNSALRTNIKQGEITMGKIHELHPFENKISVVKMKGRDIKQAMEEILSGPAHGFAVSGLKVELDTSKPPGKQVISVSKTDGSKFEENKTYSVTTFDFLADGNMDINSFKKTRKRDDTDESLRDILISAIEEGEEIFAATDGRIVNHDSNLGF
ncbi:MAG: bifunctional metallophosphatase/5'-nucleotidase [Vulcanimicrobiota bacterium]